MSLLLARLSLVETVLNLIPFVNVFRRKRR